MNRNTRMKPPKPGRPFMVNDVVRLARGWTPMTISYISPRGEITAHYGLQTFDPDGERDPNVPTSSYTRPASGFAWWDGEVFPGRNMPLTRRYTINAQPNQIGQLTGFTSNDFHILEMETGEVKVFGENEITEIKPFSFNVRFQNGSTACFTFEDPNKRVSLTDVLVTDTGDICTVIKVDVGAKAPKNFSGRRLITSEI